MIPFITSLLAIASPTFQEETITAYIISWVKKELPLFDIKEINNNLIISPKEKSTKPHISFVGHSDVIPIHFEPFLDGDMLYGSGASDMKSAVGVFLWFLKEHAEALLENYSISIIIYAREEGTPLHQNGLNELIQHEREFVESIDLAVVGEPTDNTIQLGCVGSIHATVRIDGVACHSARPWNGESALYKAIPFITYFSQLQPVKHSIFEVGFFDVISITESESEKGKTSIPGTWNCNLNYRYSPNRTLDDAKEELMLHCLNAGVTRDHVTIIDGVYAGSVIDTPLFASILEKIPCEKQAKQAWTDVAQLTELGVPAFNFGPGLTSQAHKKDEYILCSDIETYYSILETVFLGK